MRVPRSTTLEDFDVGGVRGLRVAAPEADPDRRVVHLFGGAYCIGSTTMARSFAHRVSKVARAVVYVPAYRLAPEHPFPAALRRLARAVAWTGGGRAGSPRRR